MQYSKWYGERLLVSFPRNNVTEAKNILFGIANTEKGGVLRKNYASYDPCYSFSNDFMAGFFRSLYKIDGDAQELGSERALSSCEYFLFCQFFTDNT